MKTILLSIFFLGLLFNSCQKKVTKSTESKEQEFLTAVGDTASVVVSKENVRQEPNGKILGSLKEGEKIVVRERLGNWIQFDSKKFDNAFIWGPSLGYKYINFYSPFFYFDSLKSNFHSIEYFQTILAQKGLRRQETSTSYELFFRDIGFGSHEETVLEVTATTNEVVEHGITFFINSTNDKIHKVKVDFLKPVEGFEKSLKKCGLIMKKIVDQNGGHLIWPFGSLVNELMVDLERNEWESDWFSSVWFSIENMDL
jgi:hypothetical protein